MTIRNLINKIVHKIVLFFIKYCEQRNKVEHITGHGSSETYLLRYQLIKSRYLNIYIHRVLRSDHDVPHDHPWDFFTYMVDGTYSECRYKKNDGQTELELTMEERPKGTCAFRKAADVHKLVVKSNNSVAEKEKAPLTLFITGPHKRTWGFWPGDKKENGSYFNTKFSEWRKYLKLDQ
jgi:hypothetical protein